MAKSLDETESSRHFYFRLGRGKAPQRSRRSCLFHVEIIFYRQQVLPGMRKTAVPSYSLCSISVIAIIMGLGCLLLLSQFTVYSNLEFVESFGQEEFERDSETGQAIIKAIGVSMEQASISVNRNHLGKCMGQSAATATQNYEERFDS